MKLIWQIIERLTYLMSVPTNSLIVSSLRKIQTTSLYFNLTLKKLCKNAKPRSCSAKSFQETFLEKKKSFPVV